MRIESGANKQSMFVGNQLQKNKKEEDDVLKGLQQQITNAEAQVKQLSENEGLSAEEKVNRKKELTQQIADLNKQISDRQMEVKKQEQAEKEEQMKETQDKLGSGQEKKEGTQSLDQTMMQNFITAGNALSNVSNLGQIRTRLNGEMNNLASQIDTDAAKGMDTTKKNESLADMERRIDNITQQIGKELGKVTKEMNKDNVKENEKAESTEEKEKVEEEKEEGKNTETPDPRHGNPAIDILS